MTFITIEGVDGSGKTTAIEAIKEEFDDVVTTAEPSELWTGKQVRECLQDETLDPLTDFYFFMGDRVNHIEEEVRPADESGSIVVSDRYADSTRAYQPVALGNSRHFESQLDAKLFIEETMDAWNYRPDVTIYLDISVDTALERSDQEEKYEKREFLTEVKDNYNELINIEEDRFIVIDGEQSKENVAEEVIEELNSWI